MKYVEILLRDAISRAQTKKEKDELIRVLKFVQGKGKLGNSKNKIVIAILELWENQYMEAEKPRVYKQIRVLIDKLENPDPEARRVLTRNW